MNQSIYLQPKVCARCLILLSSAQVLSPIKKLTLFFYLVILLPAWYNSKHCQSCSFPATWEPTYDPALASMSFLDYGRSNRAEDNWIVRYLTNRKQGPLSYYYVELATEVLRTKCLVGFMDYYEESIRRIEKYYGFK